MDFFKQAVNQITLTALDIMKAKTIMRKSNENKNFLLTASLLALLSAPVFADETNSDYQSGERINERLQQRGERINEHLDATGDRIQERFQKRAEWHQQQGHENKAQYMEKRGERINQRLDNKGDRIEQRKDRQGDRIQNRIQHRHSVMQQNSYQEQRATNRR